MCGRFTLHHESEDIAERFAVEQTLLELAPRYNVAPSQPVAAVVQRESRQLLEYKWGLVPFWAKEPAIGNRMINARAESLADKPAFKNAFRTRRCVIPTSGYYEWKKDGSRRTPHYIQRGDRGCFAMAGLAEKWRGPDGEVLRTCAIVTTTPNVATAGIHDRMPAILSPAAVEIWLDRETDNPETLLELLRPYAGELILHPVSARVNKPDVDDAACIEEVAPVEPDAQLGLAL